MALPAITPATPQPANTDHTAAPAQGPPVQRRVLALILDDPRASELHAAADPAHTQLLLTASRELARIGTEPRYTPHRPSLLPQLLEAVNDEDASLRSLARIVAQDPQLTGELLRSANSPLYRVSPAPVESIERATALLGTQGIRTLIASRLVQPLASASGITGRFGEMTWEHSLYSASAAEAWAARSQDADPFAAHLLALLHGVGSVTVYRVLGDLLAADPALRPDPAVIAGALHTSAAVTAARIAQHWGLSERTRQALEAQSSASPAGEPSALARALQFGLLTGGVALLCRHDKLGEDEAAELIAADGFEGSHTARIWDRLVRAYVRP